MALRLVFRDRQIGRRLRFSMQRHAQRIRRAERLAAEDALEEMVKLGRADIAQAGRFGSRWTEGLHGRVVVGRQDTRIDLMHDVPYFPVFQYGKRIHGKPLLAIPLSFASDAQGVWARDYPEPLFRVDREGKAPLLLSARTGDPKYFLKEVVTIPKKFHVLEIAREVARKIKIFFRLRMAESR